MNRLVGSAFVAMAMCGPVQPTSLAQDKGSAATAGSGLQPSKTLSGSAPSYSTDPLVVPECRLVVAERQEAPSQREGVLLFVGTEIAPGEQVPGDRMISIRSGEQERRYRRLREGDEVRAGQLLALIDDSLARDELAIKRERVAIAEAELFAAEQLRDEAKDRYLTQMKLRGGPGGPATSEEDVGSAKVVWYKNHYEAVSRKEALNLARLELHQAQTVLAMYEIRASISGVIKRIHRNPGEAVKALEPVVEVQNTRRIRVEALVDAQYLPRLQPGIEIVIHPSQPQAPDRICTGHLQAVTSVAFGRGAMEPVLLSGSEDGTVRIWDRRSGRQQQVLSHPAAVRAVACTPATAKTNLCMCGLADGSARIWDLDHLGGQAQVLVKQHQGAVTCVAFSPDGSRCITGGEDHEICAWDTATGALCYRFPPGHLGPLSSLHLAASSRLVSAGQDRTLRLWVLGDGEAKLEKTFENRSGEVSQLGVSGDCALFDQGNVIQILDLRDGAGLGNLRATSAAAGFKTLALFSVDGGLILTAGAADGQLQLWRRPREKLPGSEIRRLIAPDRSVTTCAAFSPDGSMLATGTRQREVMIWPLPGGSEPERSYRGTIVLVEKSVESGHQARVWAELENLDGDLIPGNSATMTIAAGASIEQRR
jgi:WD40 repeat protein